MWTTLVTVIRKVNRDEELDRFLASVREAGICVTELEPEEMYGLLGDEGLRQPFVAAACQEKTGRRQSERWKQEALVLTDIPQIAGKVKQEGIALLGLEWKNSGRIYAAPYILQALDGIDIEYLRMVYGRFHGEPLIIAQTKRLCIRELVCEEAEAFMRLAREAGLTLKDVPGTGNISEYKAVQAQREFVKAYIEGQYALFGYGIWGIVDEQSGELAGIAGVEDREANGEAYLELGYAVEEKWRRQGIAKEAGTAIIQFLQEELELKGKIKCFVPKGNIASQRTAQSIGMLQSEDVFDEFYCYERIL